MSYVYQTSRTANTSNEQRGANGDPPIRDLNFLSFASWFFLFCVILIVVVSMLSKAPTQEKVENLTYQTITEEEKRNNKVSFNWVDIAVSILIVIIVIGVMIFFNGE